jgi:hypothetical protein
LPPSWRDFATALKHKRVHMSISNLIASLDVEEKVGAKDERSKEVEGQTSANMVHQLQSHDKAKTKLSRIRITTSQSKLLSLRRRRRGGGGRRRRRRMRMRVASCADLRTIGQKSVQIAKEENLNLSRRL